MSDRWRVVGLGVALAVRAGRWRVFVVFACSLLLALQPSANALALKLLTDGALDGDPARVLGGVATLAVMIAVMFSAYGVSVPMQTTVTERATRLFEQDVMRLVADVPTLEPHERADFADRVEVLRTNSQALIGAVWTVVSNVTFFAGVITALGLLASANPILLLLPVFGVPLFVASARAARLRDDAVEATAPASRRALHLFRVASRPEFGAELRIFRLRDEILARHDRTVRDSDRVLSRADMRAALLTAAAWLLFNLALLGGIALVVADTLAGRSSPGQVVLAVGIAGLVQGYVSGAVGLVRDLTSSVAMAGRYLWLVDAARTMRGRGEDAPDRLRHEVRFENVSFTYPGTDVEVLHDVDLTLPAGTVLGLVGENGAGKTTLVKLLLGLYRPTSGRITVDGVDLAGLDLRRWQAGQAAAFQDFARFEFTVRESIGVGDVPRIDDDAAIEIACDRAGASPPVPMTQQLGTAWDDGVDLSVGQWQILAVARGMMRDRPLVLVLDEPTASLDVDTEHRLFERYGQAGRRGAAAADPRVTVLVSHRFSTVRMADRIVVLEDGRILEDGSHTELVGRGGVYSELYDLHAQAFR